MKRAKGIVHRTSVLLVLTALVIPIGASRQPIDFLPDAALDSCGCTAGAERLQAVWEKIAAAESVEDARAEALAGTRAARAALRRARWLAPWSDDLRDAHRRLSDYEERVNTAPDPDAVAEEFSGLVRLASAGRLDAYSGAGGAGADVGLDDDGDGNGCDYSTGDVIAIIVGFILGIIPGIILLFVLC